MNTASSDNLLSVISLNGEEYLFFPQCACRCFHHPRNHCGPEREISRWSGNLRRLRRMFRLQRRERAEVR